MGTTRLEELLQELVDQVSESNHKLDELVSRIQQIEDELNWVGEHSFAKRLVDGLQEIGGAVSEVEGAVVSVESAILTLGMD